MQTTGTGALGGRSIAVLLREEWAHSGQGKIVVEGAACRRVSAERSHGSPGLPPPRFRLHLEETEKEAGNDLSAESATPRMASMGKSDSKTVDCNT